MHFGYPTASEGGLCYFERILIQFITGKVKYPTKVVNFDNSSMSICQIAIYLELYHEPGKNLKRTATVFDILYYELSKSSVARARTFLTYSAFDA